MRKFSITSFLLFLISSLPFPLLYILSDIAWFVLYHLIGYRKKVVRMNLANSFPEMSSKERRSIERKFYRFLPDLMLEAMKMRTLTAGEMKKRMPFANPEVITDFLDRGRPVVVVSAHYGNWEWGIYRLGLATDKPLLIIYKPLSDQNFDRTFNEIRSRFGALMVPMKEALRQILKHRDQPHMSVFVADQAPPYQGSDYAIDFLNQPTLVFTGPGRIAQKLDAPMVYCHIDRVRRGYYSCRFTLLTEHPNEMTVHGLTDLHNRFTESMIRNKPELWLWSHKRWKRKPKTVQEESKIVQEESPQ